jgi:ankyrin repeat protein
MATKYLDIFQAARRADCDQFKQMLDSADLNAITTDNRNLLHVAIAYRRPDNAFELVRRGVKVNWQDKGGATPLHYAATYGPAEIVEAILQNGGNLLVDDKHGNTPLWNAVFNAKGSYNIVVLLLQKGASATQKNKHGRSPLDFAQQIGDRKLVDILQMAR